MEHLRSKLQTVGSKQSQIEEIADISGQKKSVDKKRSVVHADTENYELENDKYS